MQKNKTKKQKAETYTRTELTVARDERERKIQTSSYEMNKMYNIRNTGNGRVTDGSYTCGEQSITNKPVESLCCRAETN